MYYIKVHQMSDWMPFAPIFCFLAVSLCFYTQLSDGSELYIFGVSARSVFCLVVLPYAPTSGFEQLFYSMSGVPPNSLCFHSFTPGGQLVLLYSASRR